MQIVNKSKNTCLATKVSVADTALKRLKGLLGRGDFKYGEALLIKPCNSIHTFFMRFSIDVLFIDRENKVIKILTHLKPFRISGVYFNSSFAIECPAGVLSQSATALGDEIRFL